MNKWKELTLRLNSVSSNKIKCACGYMVTKTRAKMIICPNCYHEVLTDKQKKEQFNMGLKRALERKCI